MKSKPLALMTRFAGDPSIGVGLGVGVGVIFGVGVSVGVGVGNRVGTLFWLDWLDM